LNQSRERLGRQRHAVRDVQCRLEQIYALEIGPNIIDFLHIGEAHSRESLLLREVDDALEMALILPPQAAAPAEPTSGGDTAHYHASDEFLQLVEGVSHFVYVAERARTGLPATQLELELQAEVDKFVVLSLGQAPVTARSKPAVLLDSASGRRLHDMLYEGIRFLHAAGTEAGERYRLANQLAARFTARLVAKREPTNIEHALRRFYRAGQTEKIRLAQAA
jgi:hypothetical protein